MTTASRSAIRAASSSSSTSLASLPRTSSAPSPSTIPAAPRMISTSGQNVMPSPYERHLPYHTVAAALDLCDDLGRQPRLPGPGSSQDPEEMAGPLALHGLERVRRASQLDVAPDQR